MPLFKTNLGSFKIELDEKNAPITTRNFIDFHHYVLIITNIFLKKMGRIGYINIY